MPEILTLPQDLKLNFAQETWKKHNPVSDIKTKIWLLITESFPGYIPSESMFSVGIAYGSEDVEVVMSTHLSVLREKVRILSGTGQDYVFTSRLDDERGVIYFSSTAENDVRSAIPMANNELRNRGLPLIPELPPVNRKAPHET